MTDSDAFKAHLQACNQCYLAYHCERMRGACTMQPELCELGKRLLHEAVSPHGILASERRRNGQ